MTYAYEENGVVTAEEMRQLLEEKTPPTTADTTNEMPPGAVPLAKSRRERRAEARGEKRSGRTKPLEVLYKDLIKAGMVEIVRRPGRSPEIVWL